MTKITAHIVADALAKATSKDSPYIAEIDNINAQTQFLYKRVVDWQKAEHNRAAHKGRMALLHLRMAVAYLVEAPDIGDE